MEKFEAIAKKYFGTEVSDRDRAIFEGAITLGAIFHQFTGIPITKELVPLIKETIEKTMGIQPFIKNINVNISEDTLRSYDHTYDYSVLTGDKLELEIISQYGDTQVHLGMKHVKELDFPLMFIKKIEES